MNSVAPSVMSRSGIPTSLVNSINETKQLNILEIINLYPEADFNDAWYPFTNQVRRAGSILTG
jgi:hypothetical protein